MEGIVSLITLTESGGAEIVVSLRVPTKRKLIASSLQSIFTLLHVCWDARKNFLICNLNSGVGQRKDEERGKYQETTSQPP
jgi:hypothetical protein